MKKVTDLAQMVPDIPNWVIMPMARMAMLLGSPMGIWPARVKKLQISTNICGEKLKNCGYQLSGVSRKRWLTGSRIMTGRG